MSATRAPGYGRCTAASAAIFLPLYFYGHWVSGTRLLLVIAPIALLGAIVTPWNPGASVFFIYGAAFLGDTGAPREASRRLAILLALMMVEAWWLGWPVRVWIAPLVVGAAIGGANIHFAEVRRKDASLRVAHQAVEEMARIAERERIGRDLHDLLGHTLSVIVLKSELASKLADRDPARAAAEIRDVERISREALAEVRKAVRGYRSEGLLDEVANAERVLVAAGITPEIAVVPANLPPEEDRALAYALREAVTNVVRHAERDALLDSPGRRRRSDDARSVATTAAAGWRRKAAGCRACASDCGRSPARSSAMASHGTRLVMSLRAPWDAVVIRVLIAEDQAMVLGALSCAARHRKRHRGRGPGRDRAPKRSTSRDSAARRRGHRHRDARACPASSWPPSCKRRGSTARVVILTTFARPGYLRRALDAGASGYLLKDAPSHRLADAIRRVRNGGRAVDPELASEAWSDAGPAHRSRAPGAAARRRRPVRRRHRRRAPSVGGHGAQLPVGGRWETRRPEQGRCGEDCEGEGWL